MGLTEGASSSSGGGIGLGAGGAKSHAYIQFPPLRCDIPGAAGVMYDDGNKLLLVPAPNKVIIARSHRLNLESYKSFCFSSRSACLIDYLEIL